MVNTILIVLKHFNFGGTERYAINLANTLTKKGFLVIIVGGKGPMDSYINSNIKVIHAPIGRRMPNKKISEEIILSVAKKFKPQVIHAQCRNSLICSQLARRKLGIPVVVHEHLSYQKDEYSFVAKELKENSDKIITVTNYVAEEIVAAGLKRNNVKTIYNGINLDDFPLINENEKKESRKLLGVLPSDKVVLCLSRIVPGKGIENLVDAFTVVSKKISNAKLVIAGDDELHSTKGRIKKTLVERNLSEKVFLFPGQFNIRKFHAAADVFCYPPINRGMAVMEAMASSLPIVAKENLRKPFVAEDNKAGLLVKSDSYIELSEKLIVLLENKELAKTLGTAGREKIREEFNMDKNTLETLAVYREAISDIILKQGSLQMFEYVSED